MAQDKETVVLKEEIAARIAAYFQACNEADAEKLTACFVPDAVHYFPPGMGGPYVGREKIAEVWIKSVRENGSYWTIDRIVVDTSRREAAIEWTHFKSRWGDMLRGAEWYEFDDSLLIREIRAYYAAPRAAGVKTHQLEGFPYQERGYPLSPPQES